MYLNNYSVRVIGGNETSGGYVEMNHRQTYQLQLRNSNYRRCDARIEVDGKHVGTWRINGNQSITLERPAHDQGKFTFYKSGTSEAHSAQLSEGDPNLGLVKVTFTPESEPRPLSHTLDVPMAGSFKGIETSYSASTSASTSRSFRGSGGTGLSGHSYQQYGNADQIEYDYSGQTVIFLRLVSVETDLPRPLTQFSTPVPPRVD